MYVDLSINTNKLTYFDFFRPQKGKIDITGQDYLYEISFSLKNIKNLVDSTVDKLKGKFIFNLQGRDKPLINFSSLDDLLILFSTLTSDQDIFCPLF